VDKSVDPLVRKFRGSRWTMINRRTINGKTPRWHCKQARFYLEKGVQLQMSKSDFYKWCAANSKAILALYKKGKTPSIDL